MSKKVFFNYNISQLVEILKFILGNKYGIFNAYIRLILQK